MSEQHNIQTDFKIKIENFNNIQWAYHYYAIVTTFNNELIITMTFWQHSTMSLSLLYHWHLTELIITVIMITFNNELIITVSLWQHSTMSISLLYHCDNIQQWAYHYCIIVTTFNNELITVSLWQHLTMGLSLLYHCDNIQHWAYHYCIIVTIFNNELIITVLLWQHWAYHYCIIIHRKASLHPLAGVIGQHIYKGRIHNIEKLHLMNRLHKNTRSTAHIFNNLFMIYSFIPLLASL